MNRDRCKAIGKFIMYGDPVEPEILPGELTDFVAAAYVGNLVVEDLGNGGLAIERAVFAPSYCELASGKIGPCVYSSAVLPEKSLVERIAERPRNPDGSITMGLRGEGYFREAQRGMEAEERHRLDAEIEGLQLMIEAEVSKAIPDHGRVNSLYALKQEKIRARGRR